MLFRSHGGTGWKADDRNKRADKLMAKLLAELGINPGQNASKLDSDDLDAIICALTALGAVSNTGVLTNDELNREIAERVSRRALVDIEPAHTAPGATAVLARPFWESVNVSK